MRFVTALSQIAKKDDPDTSFHTRCASGAVERRITNVVGKITPSATVFSSGINCSIKGDMALVAI
jgi:hypothetical protein